MTERKTKHDIRSEATRERLISEARALFAERGYASVSTEEIVHAAGVTRGALYHQFRDKAELFAAVAEVVEAEVIAQVAGEMAAAGDDSVAAILAGARTLLIVCARPDVERITLIDAPAVMGAVAWRELSARYSLSLIKAALVAAMESGAFARQPVDPVAHLLMGALEEAVRYIAGADDQPAAREACLSALTRLVQSLRAE